MKCECGKKYNTYNHPFKENYWIAYVVVSIKAPDVRYSEFFNTKKEAQTKLLNGTKIIKVKITEFSNL